MATKRIHSPNKQAITNDEDDAVVIRAAHPPTPTNVTDLTDPVVRAAPAVPDALADAPSMGAFNAPVLPHLPPIIRSKIEPPPLRPTTLTRHRLLDMLPIRDPKRITLVVADPGFGKTTLLADFSSRYPGRCLWYRLDETDSDWITLANYVIAAARTLRPEFGQLTSPLLSPITGASPSKKAVMGSLMHELQGFADSPVAFVFDDFQTVDGLDDVNEFVGRMLRDAPNSFTFVISSRVRPTIHLARWLAMGDVGELTTEDLRFSTAETGRLFSEAYGQPLEAEALDELDMRTKGWAASLQLFHSLVRGRATSEVRSAVRSLSGATRPIYDFLAEEVLSTLPARLVDFALRASVLETIEVSYVAAAAGPDLLTPADAEQLMDDADKAGLISRASHASSVREFHPLLREFLGLKLAEQLSADEIAAIHERVAQVAETVDLLTAAHHHIQARHPSDAMRCLAESVVQTMGSGRWGAASRLIDKLTDTPGDPSVIAIKARRLVDDGETPTAAALLAGIDLSSLSAAARAVVRSTRLHLGWRLADSDSLFATLREVVADQQTPAFLRDIAQIYIDASPMSALPASLPSLSRRLRHMAAQQQADGHIYYAAISRHNAAVAALNAGLLTDALECGYDALNSLSELSFLPVERYSTHATLATALLELGREPQAESHLEQASTPADAEGDVYAECAYMYAVIGNRGRSTNLLEKAEGLEGLGRMDLEGRRQAARTRGFLMLGRQPLAVINLLERHVQDSPLELGFNLLTKALLATAYFLADQAEEAAAVAEAARSTALPQGNRRAMARLGLISAMAARDGGLLRVAITSAADVGQLALLEAADAIAAAFPTIPTIPTEITDSIARWPARWLPILRQQLEQGNVPAAHLAADLLDQYGVVEDIGRLRAFDKTYRRRGGTSVGKRLARRLCPPLRVDDLGRGRLRVAEREIFVNEVRRKPISLLFYLITRPSFTATREQVLENLWPDGDPDSGANSLNQSLHFLRRELDPWYEVGVSHDYISFESELLWLDNDLVSVASAEFLNAVRQAVSIDLTAQDIVAVVAQYGGQFCPEFEYDEWAMAWRTRVHAAFLDFVHRAVERLVADDALSAARDVVLHALSVDPTAVDVERRLIWLYSRLGSTSAAETQYRHLAAGYRVDGLEPPLLSEILGSPTC